MTDSTRELPAAGDTTPAARAPEIQHGSTLSLAAAAHTSTCEGGKSLSNLAFFWSLFSDTGVLAGSEFVSTSKDPKKFKSCKVGCQNFHIDLLWATVVLTLRTTDLQPQISKHLGN
jgi:hypothetical protein